MRPLVIAASIFAATCLLGSSAAAAQAPDPSPAPPGPPQEVAVPRTQQQQQPSPPPAAEERRGAVRAPDRAVEQPARTEAPSEPRPPRNVGAGEAAVPRAATASAEPVSDDDDQRGQRRGSVRQPPDDRGSRTRERAVPRAEAQRPPTRTTIIRNYPYRYYPNYARYYDPWGYGSFGLGYFYYSPWAWAPYASYGYPGYYPQYGPGFGYDVGRVRLKVQPRDAEVWVDGYYAGTVDDFDGMFQALRLDSGPYRIEIRKPGFETLTFDVRVQPDRTVTFRGSMRQVP